MEDIKNMIASYIVEFITYGDDIQHDESLVESGLIDSTSIFDLIAHIEETFEIAVDDEDIDPVNFDTVNQIATFVEAKKEAA